MVRGAGRWAAAVAGALIAAGGGGEARADDLEFAVGRGRVTVVAAGVPLRDVLAAWAQAGNTRFVGAEAIGEVPVSLHLVDVAEREALRLLLRPAAGFVAVRRAAPSGGASRYDRVAIRGVRRAAAPAPAGGRRASARGGAPRGAPEISEAEQLARLRRVLRPPPPVPDLGARAEAPSAGAAYAPTTPRPGMVVDPPRRDPP